MTETKKQLTEIVLLNVNNILATVPEEKVEEYFDYFVSQYQYFKKNDDYFFAMKYALDGLRRLNSFNCRIKQ